MTLHVLLLLTLAFLTFIVATIALVWTVIDAIGHKASDRPSGCGGISNRRPRLGQTASDW